MSLLNSLIRPRRPLTCREVVELVSAYLEGTLDAREARRFEAHIAPCDACTEYVEQLRTTIRLTSNLNHTALPAHLREELLHAFRNWRADASGAGA
jgi:anti-sigma factor RsiW